jgi:hypothetical protein
MISPASLIIRSALLALLHSVNANQVPVKTGLRVDVTIILDSCALWAHSRQTDRLRATVYRGIIVIISLDDKREMIRR